MKKSVPFANIAYQLQSIFDRTTKREFKDLCFCAKNVEVTSDIKNYIKDIEQFLSHSGKFYNVTINTTFMEQDRIKYIQPLMEGKKTINIQVQTAGNDSTTMVLHVSTDGRCSLKKGWTNFAVQNNIHLQSICIFHFYKAAHI
uniref:TF-B3 domain-containing protein n=1 Tax=Oryza meridionalis TaxID=40149 RepID=A0A0E0F7B8_9ORYZ